MYVVRDGHGVMIFPDSYMLRTNEREKYNTNVFGYGQRLQRLLMQTSHINEDAKKTHKRRINIKWNNQITDSKNTHHIPFGTLEAIFLVFYMLLYKNMIISAKNAFLFSLSQLLQSAIFQNAFGKVFFFIFNCNWSGRNCCFHLSSAI